MRQHYPVQEETFSTEATLSLPTTHTDPLMMELASSGEAAAPLSHLPLPGPESCCRGSPSCQHLQVSTLTCALGLSAW